MTVEVTSLNLLSLIVHLVLVIHVILMAASSASVAAAAAAAAVTMQQPKIIAMHWFRKGLRLHDNPGLTFSAALATGTAKNNAAVATKEGTNTSSSSSTLPSSATTTTTSSSMMGQLYPVYVMDGDCYQIKHCTALRANFLVECIQDLDTNLRRCGSRLYVTSGNPTKVLPDLWKQWGVTHLTYEIDETGEGYAKERDESILRLAKEYGIVVRTFASETIHPLEKYVDKSSSVPITMGTFQKLFHKMGRIPKPLDVPKEFPPIPSEYNDSNNNNNKNDNTLMLPPKKATDLPWPRHNAHENRKDAVTPLWGPNDCKNLTPIVRGGETYALRQLTKKVKERPKYVATFEKPSTSCVQTSPNEMSTTVLSPYMSLGCLSPRTFWYAIEESIRTCTTTTSAAIKVSKPPVSLHGQLLWREFNNLMAHTANRNQAGSWGQINGNMYCRQVPWNDDRELQLAWKEGRTGYPWIDACMVQLRQEGWIHHLGRHAVACFLTRGTLWQSWEVGAQHFESHLLDADYALNGFNWLWLSCSGFFYQYFRCYSPVSFQKKNDPNGNYIRKYLPHLNKLPAQYIYEPWKAPLAIQEQCNVRIGKDYPYPIVDHSSVSKENMGKMALAYEPYKLMAEEKAKEEKATKRKKMATGSSGGRNRGVSGRGKVGTKGRTSKKQPDESQKSVRDSLTATVTTDSRSSRPKRAASKKTTTTTTATTTSSSQTAGRKKQRKITDF